ncbi:hypothetical protein [Emticicia fontis]
MKVTLKIDREIFLAIVFIAHSEKKKIEDAFTPNMVPDYSWALSTLAFRIDANTIVRWKKKQDWEKYKYDFFMNDLLALYAYLNKRPGISYPEQRLFSELHQFLINKHFSTNHLKAL